MKTSASGCLAGDLPDWLALLLHIILAPAPGLSLALQVVRRALTQHALAPGAALPRGVKVLRGARQRAGDGGRGGTLGRGMWTRRGSFTLI